MATLLVGADARRQMALHFQVSCSLFSHHDFRIPRFRLVLMWPAILGAALRQLRAAECEPSGMAKAMEEVTKEALNLPLQQRLALAGFLLQSAEAAPDPEAEAAWDAEVRDRVQAIGDRRVTGFPTRL